MNERISSSPPDANEADDNPEERDSQPGEDAGAEAPSKSDKTDPDESASFWEFLKKTYGTADPRSLGLFRIVLGVLLAYGLGKLVTLLMSFPTALPIGWTITALVVSASIGLFFGIYPAWRAAKLDPIVALRAD